jgi:nitrate reductase NapD
MNISGVLVTTSPDGVADLRVAIDALDWAEVHQTDGSGRLIVTLDGESTEQEIERLKALKRLPGVLFAEMIVHWFEDEAERTPPVDPEAANSYLNDDEFDAGKSFYQRLKALGNF